MLIASRVPIGLRHAKRFLPFDERGPSPAQHLPQELAAQTLELNKIYIIRYDKFIDSPFSPLKKACSFIELMFISNSAELDGVAAIPKCV